MYKNNNFSPIEKILEAYGHNTILHYDKWSENHSYQSFGHVQNKKWIAGVHPSELLNRTLKKAIESIITLNEDNFSEVSKKLKNKFGEMIEDYLKERDNLKMVFMLIDFRHKPTNDDVMMYEYLKYYNIPVTIIATKSDKVSKNSYEKNKKIIKDTLKLLESDDLVLFSAVQKEGKKDVHEKIISVIGE